MKTAMTMPAILPPLAVSVSARLAGVTKSSLVATLFTFPPIFFSIISRFSSINAAMGWANIGDTDVPFLSCLSIANSAETSPLTRSGGFGK